MISLSKYGLVVLARTKKPGVMGGVAWRHKERTGPCVSVAHTCTDEPKMLCC
jgi:hypothetical protein